MKKKAFLMMEAAVVVLVTAVISVFLFRGYAVFARAQKNSAAYMQLAVKARKDSWVFRCSNGGNASPTLLDTDTPYVKKAVIFSSLDDGSSYKLDTVVLIPVGGSANANTNE